VLVRFEWDPEKAAASLAKHGVSFAEASTVFGDPLGKIVDDPRHSVGELRFVLLGHSDRHQLLAVMFTDLGEAIRLISARRATRRERREYEEG
jgi:uncharacterized DUF497 family protein